MSDTPPDYAPPKPASVKGECEVTAARDEGVYYHVNLNTMVCDCQHGKAWHLGRNKWEPANLCNHKLKAIASLCQQHPDDDELRDYYDEQLGRRYNAFEVVSAFHKELRRGDVTNALYWSTMLIPHRGMHGVIAYMRNILFEEARDITLAMYILKLSSKGRSVTRLEMQRAVHRFCVAPKKWDLPWRFDIFIDEQRGYRKLAAKYGYDVAKPKDIIPAKEHDHLRAELLEGFATADRAKVQYGLKGWFKSKSPDHEQMKLDMLNLLIDVFNEEYDNTFEYDHDYALRVHKVLMVRIRNHSAIGYHELNALCDALTGEPGNDSRATIDAAQHRMITTYPKERRVKLGSMRKIPLYAHDNHTWAGKSKMRNHAHELRPGANQDNMDFRLCGAYMGVAWRTLASKQNLTIDCKWGDVKWTQPKWLWEHLDRMWY